MVTYRDGLPAQCTQTVTHPSTNLSVHGRESHLQPVDHKSDALTIPPHYQATLSLSEFGRVKMSPSCIESVRLVYYFVVAGCG